MGTKCIETSAMLTMDGCDVYQYFRSPDLTNEIVMKESIF